MTEGWEVKRWGWGGGGGVIPLTGGLHNALKDDHDFKLLVHEGALRQVEERALGIDLVADGEW